MSEKLMTSEAYVETGGANCPRCKSVEIVAGSRDCEGVWFWQNVVCEECEFEWTEKYKLSGYDPLVFPVEGG